MGNKKSTKKNVQPFEIGELDQYLFGQGNHYEIYQKMGAHKVIVDGQEGVYFAVWAPNARRVAVVGDFNDWDFEADYMERQDPMGIYTLFIPGIKEGDLYKFCIETQQGKRIFKADPFANYAELRPGIVKRILCPFMRYIWAPGCAIREEMTKDFIRTGNLLKQPQNM